jgi:soluble lytic murein transglycosylase-like protein
VLAPLAAVLYLGGEHDVTEIKDQPINSVLRTSPKLVRQPAPQMTWYEVEPKLEVLILKREKERQAELKRLTLRFQEVERKRIAEQRLAELRLAELRKAEKLKQQELLKKKELQKKQAALPSRGGGGNVDRLANKVGQKYLVDLAIKYGMEYNIDAVWIVAMMKTESNFNPNAVSSHGAIGVMQMLPSTGRALGVSPGELYNPETNVRTCVKYLAQLRAQFGDLRMATIAYNQGEGNVRNGTYRTWYYDKVMQNYQSLK